MREKELGLPADASLARARELGSRLSGASAGAATNVTPAVLLEAADAVSGEASGLDAEERQQKEERKLASTASTASTASAASTPSLPATSDLTTTYLAMAINCQQSRGAKDDSASPPCLRYRAAICSGGERAAVQALTKMREADPRWAEICFFEGKYEMGARRERPIRNAPRRC